MSSLTRFRTKAFFNFIQRKQWQCRTNFRNNIRDDRLRIHCIQGLRLLWRTGLEIETHLTFIRHIKLTWKWIWALDWLSFLSTELFCQLGEPWSFDQRRRIIYVHNSALLRSETLSDSPVPSCSKKRRKSTTKIWWSVLRGINVSQPSASWFPFYETRGCSVAPASPRSPDLEEMDLWDHAILWFISPGFKISACDQTAVVQTDQPLTQGGLSVNSREWNSCLSEKKLNGCSSRG